MLKWWALCICALALVAGEGPEIPVVEEHLVVTGQLRPESEKDTIVAVEVLDRAEIERRGATDLRDLLTQELMIDLTRHRLFGSSLAIGGVSGENVKILVDGVPLVGRLDGVLDLEQIALGDIERVEIIEGPVSVYYGSEAMGGVVNLISREAGPEPMTGEARVDLREEETRLTGALSRRFGETALRLGVEQSRFDGFDATGTSRGMSWNGNKQGNISLRASRRVGSMLWVYQSAFFSEDADQLGEFSNGSATDRRYDTRRGRHGLSTRGHIGDNWYLDAMLAYSDYGRDRETRIVDETNGSVLETREEPAYRNRFSQVMAKLMVSRRGLMRNLEGQLGAVWDRERGSGGRIAGGNRTLTDSAVFATLRWQPRPAVTLQPMARLAAHNVYDPPLVSSLHLKVKPPERNLVWRASYSEGFRGPSLKQLYLDYYQPAGPIAFQINGNEALEPERGQSIRTSLEWESERPISLKLDLFENRVSDLIALSATRPVLGSPGLFTRTYLNIDEHETRGASLEGRYTHPHGFLAIEIGRLDEANLLETEAAAIPGHNRHWRGALHGALDLSRALTLSTSYKHSGKRAGFEQVADSGGEPAIREIVLEPYDLLDLRAAWQPLAGLRLSLTVRNLLDVRDPDRIDTVSGTAHETGVSEIGRTYQLGLAWQWSSRAR